jgi:hypothetical protein
MSTNRALGLHHHGDSIAFALVQTLAESSPQVLAAGTTTVAELPALAERLGDKNKLPWCLAGEIEGVLLRSLPPGWKLKPQSTEFLLHPASAAAFWDWEHGRFDRDDLYVWLRAGAILWSRGTPGRGRSGLIPRRGPLKENLRPILARVQADRCNVVVCIDGDAPGGDTLLQSLENAGHTPRPLNRPASEMGADPSAAGAALAAISPSFGAVFAPEQIDHSAHWRTAMGLVSLLTLAFAAALTVKQNIQIFSLEAEARRNQTPPPAPERLADLPQDLQRLLQRRGAFMQALGQLTDGHSGPLAEVEILATADSAKIRSRIRPR